MLSDQDIQWMLDHERLKISPLAEPIQSVSVDLRVGTHYLESPGGQIIDPARGLGPLPQRPHSLNLEDGYCLGPGDFLLVSTLEWVELPPHLVGFVCGKSTMARFGLQVEAAGLVDPGWKGNLTLELKNMGTDIIVLRPGMKIAQIYFLGVQSEVNRLYGDEDLNSHYQGSVGVRSGVVDALPSRTGSSALAPDAPVPPPDPG